MFPSHIISMEYRTCRKLETPLFTILLVGHSLCLILGDEYNTIYLGLFLKYFLLKTGSGIPLKNQNILVHFSSNRNRH